MRTTSMIILIFIDSFKNSGLFESLPTAAKIVGQLSTRDRFATFAEGIFQISDLVFFISTTILFVGWTIISVEKRRWSRGVGATGWTTSPPSFRAASSSGCPSPALWPKTPSCCCVMSPPAHWIIRPVRPFCSFYRIPAEKPA